MTYLVVDEEALAARTVLSTVEVSSLHCHVDDLSDNKRERERRWLDKLGGDDTIQITTRVLTGLMSASSQTMKASFPPSSKTTGVRELAAAAITFFPTWVDPTKMTLSAPPVTIAFPASPYPVTIWMRSFGAPAASMAALMSRVWKEEDHEACSETLMTIELPANMAAVRGLRTLWKGLREEKRREDSDGVG